MKRKLRIVRAAVLLAVVALVLSACGGGGGQTSGGGDQTGSGAHLLIWTGGGPGGEATKKLGEAWGKRTASMSPSSSSPRICRRSSSRHPRPARPPTS